MKLPVSPNSLTLHARQSDGGGGGGEGGCECLTGGAIAGIVIGSIAGAFLLYWLLKFVLESRTGGQTVRTTRSERPRRHRSQSRRRSYYDDDSPPVSRRRKYRRDNVVDVERPPSAYINGA